MSIICPNNEQQQSPRKEDRHLCVQERWLSGAVGKGRMEADSERIYYPSSPGPLAAPTHPDPASRSAQNTRSMQKAFAQYGTGDVTRKSSCAEQTLSPLCLWRSRAPLQKSLAGLGGGSCFFVVVVLSLYSFCCLATFLAHP